MSTLSTYKVMFHPITGEPLSPLGLRASGRPIWPIMGGSETPPEGGTGTGSDGTGGQGGTSGAGTGEGGTGSGAGTEDPPVVGDTVSKADYDALMKRMQAADQRAEKEAREKQALLDKDLGEKERAEKEAEQAKTALTAAQEVIQSLRLENAFLRDTNHTWHDPSDVLRFVRDDERVTIDEDGKVQGLEAALKDLATKKPYLVKKAEDEEPGVPSGEPQGGRRKATDGTADRSKLLTTYPALRGRTRTQPSK